MRHFYELVALITSPNIPKVKADQAQFNTIVGAIFALAGALCVLFIIIGAIQYILSQGDAGNIKKAKDAVFYAIFGLLFIGTAFFIVQFVIGIFK